MVLDTKILGPYVCITTGLSFLLCSSMDRARKYMLLYTCNFSYIQIHIHTLMHINMHIPIPIHITEIISSHWYLYFYSFLPSPIPYLYAPPMMITSPGSQQHQHVYSFVQSYGTSKAISGVFHPYRHNKQTYYYSRFVCNSHSAPTLHLAQDRGFMVKY